MQSNYKKTIVFDLETGGLSNKYNAITEFAGVVVCMESLTIIEEFQVMMKPRLNLSTREEDTTKEAKQLFKMLKVKDTETGLNTLSFKGHDITLKNLEPLVGALCELYDFLEHHGDVIEYDDLIKFEQREDIGDIVKLYFDKCYNPQALEVTGIPRELLESEGIDYKQAFDLIKDLFDRHKVGNSKPILCGHNIIKFDKPFMNILFKDNHEDFDKHINDTQTIDTLEWARLRWFEMPSYNLSTCCNEVDVVLKGAHRALADTISNAKFFIKLMKSFRGEGSQESNYVRRKFRMNY
jgi:DNA polymerase III alpha subunit (gram-positive type)